MNYKNIEIRIEVDKDRPSITWYSATYENRTISCFSLESCKEYIDEWVDLSRSEDSYKKAIEEFYSDENRNKYLYNE